MTEEDKDLMMEVAHLRSKVNRLENEKERLAERNYELHRRIFETRDMLPPAERARSLDLLMRPPFVS